MDLSRYLRNDTEVDELGVEVGEGGGILYRSMGLGLQVEGEDRESGTGRQH